MNVYCEKIKFKFFVGKRSLSYFTRFLGKKLFLHLIRVKFVTDCMSVYTVLIAGDTQHWPVSPVSLWAVGVNSVFQAVEILYLNTY